MIKASGSTAVAQVLEDGVSFGLGIQKPKRFVNTSSRIGIVFQPESLRQIIAHSKNAVHQKILVDRWSNAATPFGIVTKLGMLKETVHIDSKIERCRKVIKIEIPNQGQRLGFEPCHILERPNRRCPT